MNGPPPTSGRPCELAARGGPALIGDPWRRPWMRSGIHWPWRRPFGHEPADCRSLRSTASGMPVPRRFAGSASRGKCEVPSGQHRRRDRTANTTNRTHTHHSHQMTTKGNAHMTRTMTHPQERPTHAKATSKDHKHTSRAGIPMPPAGRASRFEV